MSMHFEAVVAIADRADSNHHVYSADSLRAAADGKTLFWSEEQQALIVRREATPEEEDLIRRATPAPIRVSFQGVDRG